MRPHAHAHACRPAMTMHEDSKLAGTVHYFLSSAPQQIRSDGLTNVHSPLERCESSEDLSNPSTQQLNEVLSKETKHAVLGRRMLAVSTLAMLAPVDNKAIDGTVCSW